MRISDWSSDVCSSDLARVDLQFMIKRAADRRHHVDALTFGLRRLGRDWRHISVRPLPAERLHLAFIEDVGEHRLGIGDTPRFGDLARLFDSRLGRSEEHTSELQSLMRTSYAVFCLQNTKTNT